jgi:hypothetical protein
MEKTYSHRLKEILFLLASSPEVQFSVFPEFVHIPDEIASETSDAIEYAPNEISQEDSVILVMLRKADAVFDEMSGDAANWTEESIKTNPIWQQIRLLAMEEINRLGLKYKRPDLFWLTYCQDTQKQ